MKPQHLITRTIRVKAITSPQDCVDYANRRRNVVQTSIQQRLKEFQIDQPVCDLGFTPFITCERNPNDEIINLIDQYSNVALAGWFFFFETVRLRRELADLKGRTVQVVESEVCNA